MQYVTNGKFGILLIPECKQYSVSEIGSKHDLAIQCDYVPEIEYIIPYRNSYDRIIRGIGADLHEIMHDSGFVNLNVERWVDVRDKCLEFISAWLERQDRLPIAKHFCHTAYFGNYVGVTPRKYRLIDVEKFDLLPKFIKETYDFDIGEIPELSAEFYEHTVPYWEIDALFNSHKKMRTLIEEWCALDQKLSTMKVDDLFINT